MKKSKKMSPQEYHDLMFRAEDAMNKRILIGVPMTGIVRSEWAFGRMCQVIPCNWSSSDSVHWLPHQAPLGYAVAEARNAIINTAVTQGFDWLLFIDHDVIMRPDTFVRINQYMMKGDIPVVSGLYFAKCNPPSPLVYRGRGNGSFNDWRIGDKVWVDGIPMGLALINVKLLKVMWEDAPEYEISGGRKVKKVFDTPAGIKQDPINQSWNTFAGTEDLTWCNRVMNGGYFKKAGFPKYAKMKHPFLIDTSMFCRHITMDGTVYPYGYANLEKSLFERESKGETRWIK